MTIRETMGPDESELSDLGEDLRALAEYEFRVAQTECVDCHEYHALFGYTRLAGVNKGMSSDHDIVKSVLQKVSPANARILIAGAADAGLLALTARSTQARAPIITVADRCATPLAVCRHYAELWHLNVATVQVDLVQVPVAGPYDVAFAHNVLLFIPVERRVDFLRNVGCSLKAGGLLVLVNRIRAPKREQDGSLKFGNFAEEIEKGLAANGIPLPEAAERFRRRLEIAAAREYARSNVTLTLAKMEESLAAAGFRIVERIDHYRRRTTFARDGGNSEAIPTYIFTASYPG